MAEAERERNRTLSGHDARCISCGCAPWVLWIENDPPPPGCSEGHDDDISRCPFVYSRLVSVVIRQDHMEKPLAPEHEDILRRLGPKADPILANIRAGKMPPEHRGRPVNWDLGRAQ